VLADAAAAAIAGGERLCGFFGTPQGNLPFRTADGGFDPASTPPGAVVTAEIEEVDRLRKKYGGDIHYTAADRLENPTLADMSVAALDVLESRGRFWLMVEAGDPDWAAHANNIDTCIGAIQSGADAFTAVVEWIEARDAWNDTVVLVTSDHGHAFVLTDPEALLGPTPATRR
jgi:alkaline phosphatase